MHYELWSNKNSNSELVVKFASLKLSGFTLVEVLIALFIFAILGTITIIGVRSVIHTYQRMKAVNHELEQIQAAVTQMLFYFIQMIQRPILNENGKELPPLLIDSEHRIEFTTAGNSNPSALEKRGTLTRVAYDWRDGELIRFTWPALDRSPQTTPERRVLLRHVTQMTLRYVNLQDQLMNVWVTDNTTSNPLIRLPQAIVVTLTLSSLGVWQGVFPIAGRGYGE